MADELFEIGDAGFVLAVASGSTVAPGNSVGTLNLAGNATFQSGSALETELQGATSADLLSHSGGTLSFASGFHLSLIQLGGSYNLSQNYTIVSSTGTLNTSALTLPASYTVGGSEPASVEFDTSGFNTGDAFTLSESGSTLVLNFVPTPTPEPTLLLVFAAGIVWLRWKNLGA
jgi:hypothetical protein